MDKDYEEVDQTIIIPLLPTIKSKRDRSSLLSQTKRLLAHTTLHSVLISSSHLPRICRGTFITGFQLNILNYSFSHADSPFTLLYLTTSMSLTHHRKTVNGLLTT